MTRCSTKKSRSGETARGAHISGKAIRGTFSSAAAPSKSRIQAPASGQGGALALPPPVDLDESPSQTCERYKLVGAYSGWSAAAKPNPDEPGPGGSGKQKPGVGQKQVLSTQKKQ